MSNERLMTTMEVATMFRVERRTVERWARTGKLDFTRTASGYRRFRESDVRALYSGRKS